MSLQSGQLRIKKFKHQIQEFERRLNKEQKEAIGLIEEKALTIIYGKAGSGKTLTACFSALKKFSERNVDNIVITRPTVSTEDNGFLPGGIDEKLEPWVAPIHGCIKTMLKETNTQDSIGNSLELYEQFMKTNSMEIVPLTYMRGRTFSDSFIIVDEAQNMTLEQTMMVISRVGKNSKIVICGDSEQIDLKRKSDSGIWFLKKLMEDDLIGKISLTTNHRHPLVDNILMKYENYVNSERVSSILKIA